MAVRAVYALHTAEMLAPQAALESGASLAPVRVPILAFAVEHAAGWVLVDAGVGAGWRQSPLGRLALGAEGGPQRWREQLAALGTRPEQALAIVMTHLDTDHTGGLPECENVPLVVAARELRAARQPGLSARWLGRYCPEEFEAPLVRRVFVPDRCEPPLDLGPFERGYDVLGDGTIVAVALEGHTAGHCGVLVRGPAAARVLLCGDAVHTAQLLSGTEPGWIGRLAAEEPARMRRTLAGLRALARRGDVTIVPSHDPGWGERCRSGPCGIVGSA